MLFHEIYGSYFNIVAKVLKEACNNSLDDKRLYGIVRENGFGETSLEIPAALKNGDWLLLTPDMKTPIKHPPTMPLTLLQKRWMASILNDPRIKLFGVPREGLEGIAPLYTQEVFQYFDRCNDGDPFDDENYISHFRSILSAIKEKRLIEVRFTGSRSTRHRTKCFPWRLEYSSKDDKFRLVAAVGNNTMIINMGRIVSVTVLDHPDAVQLQPKIHTRVIIAELKDERNALERAMLHFSHLQKETVRLDDNRYQLTLRYLIALTCLRP